METELLNHDTKEETLSSGTPDETTKLCPFCAERIQALAIKCRHCGEFLDGSTPARRKARPKKWYFSTGTVVLALLCVGPLGLPLVWLNPRYKPLTKVAVTVLVLGLTVACIYAVMAMYEQLMNQIKALGI